MLKHPYDNIYMPNSCQASNDPFFLPYNDQLTSKVDDTDICVQFITFEKKI